LVEVDERTLALEARSFSAAGPKTSLRDVPDTMLDRMLRWGTLLLVVMVVAARLAGALR
jgi:energy-coupling factor transport system permease protein